MSMQTIRSPSTSKGLPICSVTYMKDNGSVGYKTKDTLEDAIAWQLEQKEVVSECADASQIEDHGCDVAPNEESCEAEEQQIASQMLVA